MPTILVAEDDRAVRESLARALQLEGYEIVEATDGAGAIAALDGSLPDLFLLDIMMPFVDGISVCRTIRNRGITTPVLMLTARHEIDDRVAGLDAGADDYLVKPFALDELLARVRALLRRNDLVDNGDRYIYEDLMLDPAARTVQRDGNRIDLTKTEFDLLELLISHAEIVVERDTIYERIWGIDFATSSNSLDVYIGYLRRKTEQDGRPRLVQTVRGVGYVLRSQ